MLTPLSGKIFDSIWLEKPGSRESSQRTDHTSEYLRLRENPKRNERRRQYNSKLIMHIHIYNWSLKSFS